MGRPGRLHHHLPSDRLSSMLVLVPFCQGTDSTSYMPDRRLSRTRGSLACLLSAIVVYTPGRPILSYPVRPSRPRQQPSASM